MPVTLASRLPRLAETRWKVSNEDGRAAIDGDLVLDGVAGSGASIRLEFQDPGGARTGRLLPTGNVLDRLDTGAFGAFKVSMVDAANPCVFVAAAELDVSGTELPDDLQQNDALLARLEAIRCHASVAMGLAATLDEAAIIPGVPKVAMIAAPAASPTLSGKRLAAGDVDILVRMISIGQPHRAVPLTGALCLAAACRVPGSVAAQRLTATSQEEVIRIGHPSGVVLVGAETETRADGVHINQATVFRTSRRLFQGEVFYRAQSPLTAAAV